MALAVVQFSAQQGEAPQAADPCAPGRFGPAAELRDVRPVQLDFAGADAFAGVTPTADIVDPCGLRYADLSGVWSFNGRQAVSYHDLRSGRFRMRLTHVPFDDPYFETWAMRFGYEVMEGVIRPEAEELQLSLNSIYPPHVEATCPDRFRHRIAYISVRLGYDDEGRVLLQGVRPRPRIDEACVETLMEFETDTITRTGVEEGPP